jgi:hypothetical protein
MAEVARKVNERRWRRGPRSYTIRSALGVALTGA